MFCPKCGTQNPDETTYCRGCGGELSGMLAPIANRSIGRRRLRKLDGGPMTIAEKQIELFSRGVRGLIMGSGLFIVAALAFILSTRGLTFSLFMLAFGFLLVGTGISRLIHARGLKRLTKQDEPSSLPPGDADYIKPRGSIYQTGDLIPEPLSITDRTTTHLRTNDE